MTEPTKKRWPWLVTGGMAAAVVAAAAAVIFTQGTAPATLPQRDGQTPRTGQSVDLGVPVPTDLAAEKEGDGWIFTWSNPDPQPGDIYQWQRTDTGAETDAASRTDPTVTVHAENPCISVILVRDNGQFSDPVTKCAVDR